MLLFEMVMGTTETQQTNLTLYNLFVLKVHKVDKINHGIVTRPPSDMDKMESRYDSMAFRGTF